MHFFTASPRRSLHGWIICIAALTAVAASPRDSRAEALLLVEADSGKVLQAENATYPWYPASVTKIMTLYVTLQAVKEGKLRLDSLITVSPNAAAQSPSKMGFRPGIQLTVDNALKMMMVKSANDIAVVLAEGVGGSVDGFSDMMNAAAARLGMTQTHYVNPNGLPAEGHVTSARDLAILARAVLRDLPEYESYVHIPAMRFGKRVTRNFNKLIGRYPGADGFKTGFICASGYNLVASATHNGRRLIAVVLGASSGQDRAVKAVQMLEKGFSNNSLTWLMPTQGTVDNLAPIAAAPPNLRDEMCGPKRKRGPASDEDETVASTSGSDNVMSMFQAAPTLRPSDMIAAAPEAAEPVLVYTGPARSGAALIAAEAADAAQQQVHKGKKTRNAKHKGGKAGAVEEASAGNGRASVTIDTTKQAAKPGRAKHANAAADNAATAKPASVKPKPAAKPAPKSATGNKPAKPNS